MYLHKDKETFKEIIEQVADDTGCAAVVIEKDDYVAMIKIPENEQCVSCILCYCIFHKNCASVPEERSAIPLQTEQSSAG